MESVVAAAVAKYYTLTMVNVTRPPLYMDSIPQTDSAGNLITTSLGYVNLVDEGTNVTQGSEAGFDFEYHPIEQTTLRFEVYGATLEFVDLVMIGIKYADGTVGVDPAGQKGFDFGTLAITGQGEMECRRLDERRSKAPQASETGGYVYQGTIRYSVEANVQ